MKTMKIGILLVVFISSSSALSSADPCNSLDMLNWVLGEWKADGGVNTTLESWKAVSPKTFEGSGETRNRRTNVILNSESLRLLEMSGAVFYVAKVGRNELPVAFRLTECSENRAVFENAGHDFPKKLEYLLVSENKLVVSVSDGKDKGFKINFVRDDN